MSEPRPRLSPPPRIEAPAPQRQPRPALSMLAVAVAALVIVVSALVLLAAQLRQKPGDSADPAATRPGPAVAQDVAPAAPATIGARPRVEIRAETAGEVHADVASTTREETDVEAGGGAVRQLEQDESGHTASAPGSSPGGSRADPAAGRFEAAMSVALRALAAGDLDGAEGALTTASALAPGSATVAEARQRLEQARVEAMLAGALARARAAEAAEDWGTAATAWGEALVLAPGMVGAAAARERALARGRLAARIDGHLAHPERLSADEVLAEAEALLAEAASADPPGPRLTAAAQALSAVIGRAREAVAILLRSDGETEVRLLHRGPIGRFTERRLELRPGRYTAVGSRVGYRDVRVGFDAAPGAAPVVVQCGERL